MNEDEYEQNIARLFGIAYEKKYGGLLKNIEFHEKPDYTLQYPDGTETGLEITRAPGSIEFAGNKVPIDRALEIKGVIAKSFYKDFALLRQNTQLFLMLKSIHKIKSIRNRQPEHIANRVSDILQQYFFSITDGYVNYLMKDNINDVEINQKMIMGKLNNYFYKKQSDKPQFFSGIVPKNIGEINLRDGTPFSFYNGAINENYSNITEYYISFTHEDIDFDIAIIFTNNPEAIKLYSDPPSISGVISCAGKPVSSESIQRIIDKKNNKLLGYTKFPNMALLIYCDNTNAPFNPFTNELEKILEKTYNTDFDEIWLLIQSIDLYKLKIH